MPRTLILGNDYLWSRTVLVCSFDGNLLWVPSFDRRFFSLFLFDFVPGWSVSSGSRVTCCECSSRASAIYSLLRSGRLSRKLAHTTYKAHTRRPGVPVVTSCQNSGRAMFFAHFPFLNVSVLVGRSPGLLMCNACTRKAAANCRH